MNQASLYAGTLWSLLDTGHDAGARDSGGVSGGGALDWHTADGGGVGAVAAAAATAGIEAMLESGALDAYIERIVYRLLAEADAAQNVLSRRGGGYRPGAFGSLG